MFPWGVYVCMRVGWACVCVVFLCPGACVEAGKQLSGACSLLLPQDLYNRSCYMLSHLLGTLGTCEDLKNPARNMCPWCSYVQQLRKPIY